MKASWIKVVLGGFITILTNLVLTYGVNLLVGLIYNFTLFYEPSNIGWWGPLRLGIVLSMRGKILGIVVAALLPLLFYMGFVMYYKAIPMLGKFFCKGVRKGLAYSMFFWVFGSVAWFFVASPGSFQSLNLWPMLAQPLLALPFCLVHGFVVGSVYCDK